jgi:hypothetical protein
LLYKGGRKATPVHVALVTALLLLLLLPAVAHRSQPFAAKPILELSTVACTVCLLMQSCMQLVLLMAACSAAVVRMQVCRAHTRPSNLLC